MDRQQCTTTAILQLGTVRTYVRTSTPCLPLSGSIAHSSSIPTQKKKRASHTGDTPFGNDQHDVGREHPRALVPLPGEGYLRPLFPARLDRDRQLGRRLRQFPVGVKPLCIRARTHTDTHTCKRTQMLIPQHFVFAVLGLGLDAHARQESGIGVGVMGTLSGGRGRIRTQRALLEVIYQCIHTCFPYAPYPPCLRSRGLVYFGSFDIPRPSRHFVVFLSLTSSCSSFFSSP